MVIGRRRRGASQPMLVPASAREEAMRILRSNLLTAIGDLESAVVVVTSSSPEEGKTSTCVALARSMAMARRRVVLVDLDLRHPDAHNHVDAERSPGASEVLRGTVPIARALQYIEVAPDRGMYFLPAGELANDPAELLSTARTASLLGSLAAQADIVLVDTPPVLPVADTLVIGRQAVGALLVVQAGRTSTDLAERAKDALIRSQCRLLGVVVNRMHAAEEGYGYGYGYGAAPNEANR